LSYLLWRSGQVGDAVDLLKSVHARLSRTFCADHENTKTAQQALDRMRRATPPSATVSVPLFSVSTGRCVLVGHRVLRSTPPPETRATSRRTPINVADPAVWDGL
jgi:hypothetical protein